ncbi:hypothetical protein QJS04_geneDACA004549 [Acorus gramineus]|uniref:Uncharacterized protein n=1 Tax=Acorus gramineus TaxID=55184 RepID=A0AAV9BVH4_ACOGR|nr:hypothetical protein QJS04_geneDACA004549 [Acorus gramineus]
MAGCRGEEIVSREEAPSMEKKYEGIAPKKKPLISKDHGRAFFDSADWALGKQDGALGQKSRASVETLQPKLQVLLSWGPKIKPTSINPMENDMFPFCLFFFFLNYIIS